MAVRSLVLEPQKSASGEVYSSGEFSVRVQLLYFQELQVARGSGLYRMRGQTTATARVLAYEGHITATYPGYFVSVNQPRRVPMLEVLRRLRALKAEMRKKYGEFDVDKELQEMRAERLARLE